MTTNIKDLVPLPRSSLHIKKLQRNTSIYSWGSLSKLAYQQIKRASLQNWVLSYFICHFWSYIQFLNSTFFYLPNYHIYKLSKRTYKVTLRSAMVIHMYFRNSNYSSSPSLALCFATKNCLSNYSLFALYKAADLVYTVLLPLKSLLGTSLTITSLSQPS